MHFDVPGDYNEFLDSAKVVDLEEFLNTKETEGKGHQVYVIEGQLSMRLYQSCAYVFIRFVFPLKSYGHFCYF